MKERIRLLVRRLVIWACPEINRPIPMPQMSVPATAPGAHAHQSRPNLGVPGAHAWLLFFLLIGFAGIGQAAPQPDSLRAVRNAFRGYAFDPQNGGYTSVGSSIAFQNAGTPLGTAQTFNCSTNTTCSLSAGVLTITASSTASTAWSSLTAGTNIANAFLIGNGGSLGTTGTGSITATSMPYTGLTSLGSGVSTWLGTPTATNLASALGSQTANTVFGNCTGSSAAPSFCAITTGMLPTLSTTVSGQTCTIGSTCTIPYSGLSGTPTLEYQTVQNAGTPVTQEAALNFTGTAVTSVVSAAGVTTVTLTAGAGGSGCTPPGGTGDVLVDGGAGACNDFSQLTVSGNTLTGGSSLTADFSGITLAKIPAATFVPGTTHGVLLSEGSAANYASTATGTAGQVLISQGSSSDPVFADPVISYNNPSETTAAWTSATANNTVLSVTLPVGLGILSTVTVTLNQGSTITGGAVSFLASDTTSLTNTYPVYCVPQGASTGPVSSYTLTASTNIAFQCSLSSFEAFEVKLSPAITGTGTVNVGIQPTSAPSQVQIAVVNFPTTQAVSGTVTANQGTSPWVASCTAANCAVNEAQVAGTATSVSRGATDAGTQRVIEASDTPVLENGLSTTVQTVVGSAALLDSVYCYNPNSSVAYVQIFDISGTVTLGTSTPKWSTGIAATAPGGASGLHLTFANAIKVAITTTATGSAAVTTAVDCNFGYK